MKQENHHENLVIKDVGLVISEDHQFLAGSPDGIVTCDCHGDSLIEIKCPFKHRYESVYTAAKDNVSFPLRLQENEFILPSSHPYFYQVQLQMFVTGIHSSYFVVFTSVDLVSVLVTFDEEFIQSKLSFVRLFWEKCVIPEMIGTAFTRPKMMVENADKENSYPPCWCKQDPDENMILCNSDRCFRKIFHSKCVKERVKRLNLKIWKCDDCKNVIEKEKRKIKYAEKKALQIQNVQV